MARHVLARSEPLPEGQAQMGCRALASQRAFSCIGVSPLAIRSRASHQRPAHSAGSLTTVSGWAWLRATNPGKTERPVGWPMGW